MLPVVTFDPTTEGDSVAAIGRAPVESGSSDLPRAGDVMPFHVLIVGPDPDARAAIERALGHTGYLVTYVTEFEPARQRLRFSLPDLLVTSVKLGAYNGLHLILRAHAERPEMPAIVLHTEFDPVLASEAKHAGAEFVTLPFDEARFAALIAQLLGATTQSRLPFVPRRWPRKQVEVPANVGGNDARVVDVSYPGLRVEIGGIDRPLARLGTVEIPGVGAVPVHPVWARGGGTAGTWWCGAEIDATDAHTSDIWRRFVDSMSC